MEITLAQELWKDVPADAQALVDSWLVAEGDHVDAGQVIARVVLAKSTVDVTAPADCVLGRIEVPAGQYFSRGQPIARLQPD